MLCYILKHWFYHIYRIVFPVCFHANSYCNTRGQQVYKFLLPVSSLYKKVPFTRFCDLCGFRNNNISTFSYNNIIIGISCRHLNIIQLQAHNYKSMYTIVVQVVLFVVQHVVCYMTNKTNRRPDYHITLLYCGGSCVSHQRECNQTLKLVE